MNFLLISLFVQNTTTFEGNKCVSRMIDKTGQRTMITRYVDDQGQQIMVSLSFLILFLYNPILFFF
jgi:hypothetical protein